MEQIKWALLILVLAEANTIETNKTTGIIKRPQSNLTKSPPRRPNRKGTGNLTQTGNLGENYQHPLY